MKTTVIHHSADYDGIFCREISRKFLPDAEFIGWDFPDEPIDWERLKGRDVYVMDLPCDAIVGAKFPDDGAKTLDMNGRYYGTNSLTWIDHHKSAIESHPHDAITIPGYRIDGVAACRLAWQWFTQANGINRPPLLPGIWMYQDRTVSEPLAVRLAGEYDVWDKRDPRVDVFQFGLRSVDIGSDFWEALLQTNGVGEKAVEELLENGYLLQRYQARNDAGMMHRSFLVEFEGLKFLALTTARCNSLTFAALDKPETGHDALMGFYYNGSKWTVSLYHAQHRKDIDLSQIAVKHGGGGHRGACGFTTTKLPFIQ